MKVLTFLPLVATLTSCGYLSEPLERAEHGWKTKYVTATRYANPVMGFNIGFKFPLHLHDSDSPELFQFIELEGKGHIYSGGGYPGAEVFATFTGVTDKDSADHFLIEEGFMSKLDNFMSNRK